MSRDWAGIRPVTLNDRPQISRWRLDPDVRRGTFTYPFPPSEATEERWFAANVDAGDGRNAVFGILSDQAGDDICGLVMLRSIDLIHRAAWFGIFIGDPAKRGHGRAKQATISILNFGFDTIGLNRIALEVDARSSRTRDLYMSVGFKEEGVLRQAKFAEGAFCDVVIMAALASDRPEHNPAA